jgi:hypothetical protein
MRALKVPDGLRRVDTIASWALRLSLSYPETSRWTIERPEGPQWAGLYGACSNLLDCSFVRRILRASYGGLYVDEYQDCTCAQHQLVLKLARDLPCRIVGNPLQGIFDFDGDPIDWERDITGCFPPLGRLEIPHRWDRAGTPELGVWLRDVRSALETNQTIDLTRFCQAVSSHIVETDGDAATDLLKRQRNTCLSLPCAAGESVIAIHKGEPTYKAKCHHLAKQLRGLYSSIEEIEGNDLFGFVNAIENARTDSARLKRAVKFAKASLSGVGPSLSAATERGERVAIRENTRNAEVALAGNAYLAHATSANLATFLSAVRKCPGVHIARGDLFNRAIGVLAKHAVSPELTLAAAAEKYQTLFRYRGRPVGRRRLIGTTLLVKGLEFQHAIVLDASSLSRRELYVALTRGAKSLTIISSASLLTPAD